MNVENQNSAGTTSALAQKTGIKPLSKIIAGVGAAIVALVALCTISGDPAGVAAVKNSVWEFDPTVTLEEAVERFCQKGTNKGELYFEDPKEFQEKGLPSAQKYRTYGEDCCILDTGGVSVDGLVFKTIGGKAVFKTNCGKEDSMIRNTLCKAFTKTRKAEWIDGGETSTGIRSVTLKIFDEGKQWIELPYADSKLEKQALAAIIAVYEEHAFASPAECYYLVEAKVDILEKHFLVYPDGSVKTEDYIGGIY